MSTLYPRLHVVRDTLDHPGIAEVEATTIAALERCAPPIRPGMRVAITAGSRGIADIVAVVRGIVQYVRAHGGDPFVFPAMGSHGGGTAEGQRAVLAELGMTEATLGAPIHAQMEVVDVGTTPSGVRVVCDKLAHEADGIIIAGRVKPHTDFSGAIESGILKMATIGLGKTAGAKIYHAAFARFGYERIIRETSAVHLAKLNILAGVGIVEDNRGRTNTIEANAPGDIVAAEERLLALAKSLISTLPFAELDLLVVDAMGKNISGCGMDTNVHGRAVDGRTQKTPTPRIKQLFVRELTPESQGNATGIGLADFTTRRLANTIDWHKTYLNCLTAAQPAGARLPIVCETDAEAIRHALTAAGVEDAHGGRIVRIANTLHMEAMLVSAAALQDIKGNSRYAVGAAVDALDFDGNGNLREAGTLAAV